MDGEMYIINLARRTDRWTHWQDEAKKWGVPEKYKRFNAFDGKDLKITEDLKHLFRNNDFDDNPWVIGCALSHFYLWMYQYENKIPYVIIFEDDATFSRPFAFPSLPEGWDLFYFGGTPYPDIQPPGTYYSDNIIIPELKGPLFFNTIGYMISLQGVAKALKKVNEIGIGKNIDRFLMDLHSELHVFCYSPLIIYDDRRLGTDIYRRPYNIGDT